MPLEPPIANKQLTHVLHHIFARHFMMDGDNSAKFRHQQPKKKALHLCKAFLLKRIMVARAGIEPATQGFSILCSTD